MSVRATERLIGDVVAVTGLSNSPRMVVLAVDIDAKQVTAVWFADDHRGQQGVFPATALDRVETPELKAEKKAVVAAGGGTRGRKPGKAKKQ
ncbi:MAG: hypothetical protein LBU16_01090 [Treponema sp.]|jgi:hypothetical protein|nr:hypothetical protein [Treponema sp.]